MEAEVTNNSAVAANPDDAELMSIVDAALSDGSVLPDGGGGDSAGGDAAGNVDAGINESLFKKYGDVILRHEVGDVLDKLKDAEGDESVLVELYSKVTGKDEGEIYDKIDGLDDKALAIEKKKMLSRINSYVEGKRKEVMSYFSGGGGVSESVTKEAEDVLNGLKSGDIKVMGVDLSDFFGNLDLSKVSNENLNKREVLARMAIASVPEAFDEFVRRLVASKAKAIAKEVRLRMANAGAAGGGVAGSSSSGGSGGSDLRDYFQKDAKLYSVRPRS